MVFGGVNSRAIEPATETVEVKRHCVLVGEGNLLIRSGELLHAGGLVISAVVSDDAQVARWATEREVPVTGHGIGLLGWLSGIPHDYLLSIFNLEIIQPEILRLPRIAALNYHDGPLPAYAGLHATSWALLNEERTHGITWHLMEPGIDTGAIVRQRMFDVEADDSALSLNLKCSVAALDTLGDLVPALVSGSLVSSPQRLADRSYFSGAKRPPAGTVIDWTLPADRISALIRACDFGSYFNPLGMPKIWTGSDYLIVRRVSTEPQAACVEPGAVSALNAGGMTIGTGSNPVTVSGFATLDGETLSASDLRSTFGIDIGARLPALTPGSADELLHLSESLARHERYWEKRLQSLIPPAPRSHPDVAPGGSNRPVRHAWRIPRAVEEWLARGPDQRTREEFLLAACGVFIAKLLYRGCFDVEVVDGPADVPAPVSAAVPFRFEVDGDFTALLSAVGETLAEMRYHRTYPRDLVLRSPLLRDRTELRRRHKLPIAVVCAAIEFDASDHELVIQLPTNDDSGWLIAAPDKYDAVILAQRFSQLLVKLATTDGSLSDVSLADPAELCVVEKWGHGPRATEPEECLHQLFEAQVARTPDAVALQAGTAVLSYRDLNRRADDLAARLRQFGVRPGDFVGICLERSQELIIGLLAILKAGACYVPLDPRNPKKRTHFIARDIGIRTFLTTSELVDQLPQGDVGYLCIDGDGTGCSVSGDRESHAVGTPRSCAYIISTSGSTGDPKAVVVEHRSAVQFVKAAVDHYQLRHGDRVLQFASVAFDASVEEIFPALSSGATLVLRTETMVSSAREFFGQCELLGITVVDLPTAYWNTIVRRLSPEHGASCPTLRLVIIGGETVEPASLASARRGLGDRVRVINTYGCTETTVVSTWIDISDGEETGSVPIGVPIPGTTVHVLDRDGAPLPPGLPGQLHIGGMGVARGYLNRPELTSTRFTPSPSGEPEERLYATGDLCSWRPDGILELHGRIDDQVKIRGHRVELGEVEAALEADEDVGQVCVVLRHPASGAPGPAVMRACIVADSAAPVDIPRIRADLTERLPSWMIPGEWLVLEEIPLSVNGKIDRGALAEWELPEREIAGPQTLLEAEILRIWQSLFGRVAIALDDDFFELGGHSLLAVQIVDRLERQLGRRLPLTALFQTPTVASLARSLSDETWAPTFTSLVPVQPSGSRPPLFMMHGVSGIAGFHAFARRLSPDQPVYGLQAVLKADNTLQHTSLSEMAAHYADEIRRFQAEGPYILGGFSLGGWIAYEVGRQLQSTGERVALVIVDTFPFCHVPRRARPAYVLARVSRLISRTGHHFSMLSALEPHAKVRYVLTKARAFVRSLSHPASGTLAVNSLNATPTEGVEQSPASNPFIAMAAQHTTGVFGGDADLLLGDPPFLSGVVRAAQAWFWRTLVRGRVKVHPVPFSHTEIFEEDNVSTLADTFEALLAAPESPKAQHEQLTQA